MKEIILIQK